jgi:5-amino-6-(5-phosphoribosylamino)uracil reductase
MSSSLRILKSKPLVIASCACSLDGYLDDSSSKRLILSSEEDYQHVRRLRATCDAILVGAETIRNDDPRLTIRLPELEQHRILRGIASNLTKVTMTSSGNLPLTSQIFVPNSGKILIFCDARVPSKNLEQLSTVATLIKVEQVTARGIVANLWDRGISSVLVEGGSRTLQQFLKEGQVHTLRLARAPFELRENGVAGLFHGDSKPDLPKPFAQEHFDSTSVTWHQMLPFWQPLEISSTLRECPHLSLLELKSGHSFTIEEPIENLKSAFAELTMQGFDTNHALIACSKIPESITTLVECKVRHVALLEPPSKQHHELLQTAGIGVSVMP